ncbi:PP2C family protein-serine/threonine phosphatase [Amycolatopsis vastitatis]|uniref:Serine/threonine protein phosphatase n=1 Tax=Amycolatopsis vastitatis TaxID=1905142 RepID=A0A229SWL2_9PSEU|nr:PP2C family protein-serine/threonine phosphatase [Amycolatopsis vastitatis]OXM62899.1 serine/threonine protein phosphatase [Amycolatopsis vastitatis]
MKKDHRPDRAAEQQRSLTLAFKRAELSVEDLWLRYFGVGGEAGFIDIDAYVHGLADLPPLERDTLALAVNERLDELTWTHRAGFSRQIRDSTPRTPPFTALVQLLEGTELAPPDRLSAAVKTAAAALGVRIGVYLVDYDQLCLRPLPDAPSGELSAKYPHPSSSEDQGETSHRAAPPGQPASGRTALDVDTTLAGRAFRQIQILPSETSGPPRLWVPLMDGAERLGVLDVEVDDADDLYDPGLRVQCRWLSMLLGHMVTLLSQYGDDLDRVRLRTRRTVNADLVWSLLPPLTAGVDSFIVTGVVEPRDDVSGDAFDYALSETTASLMVLDAVGHDLRSGLIAATAVSAYRSARRAGHGLFEQARLIDETISGHFGDSAFATAVLVELDLTTGRLRYINAGHPHPLVMRAGKIVKPLAAGRCLPLGLGLGDLQVGEETLEPEDWLVLYTDGVTEARDHTGEFFGEPRLRDFLRREAAAGNPPPETARRLTKAVLRHQNGTLQDDATVLLARWTRPARMTP